MTPKPHVIIHRKIGEQRVRKLCHDAMLTHNHRLQSGIIFKFSYGKIEIK